MPYLNKKYATLAAREAQMSIAGITAVLDLRTVDCRTSKAYLVS